MWCLSCFVLVFRKACAAALLGSKSINPNLMVAHYELADQTDPCQLPAHKRSAALRPEKSVIAANRPEDSKSAVCHTGQSLRQARMRSG